MTEQIERECVCCGSVLPQISDRDVLVQYLFDSHWKVLHPNQTVLNKDYEGYMCCDCVEDINHPALQKYNLFFAPFLLRSANMYLLDLIVEYDEGT